MSDGRWESGPGSETMLGRLGIRQKLSLLLMIPLAAVVLTMVPFTAERVDDARAAGTTARTAVAAREIGAVIQTLQEERLLALGYLAEVALDRSALLAKTQTAIDGAARLGASPTTAAAIRQAAQPLQALDAVRQRVLSRSVAAGDAYRAYREATTALLGALRLANPPGADAEGLGQLAALDALMRSNEEASSAGAILVAVAGGLPVSRSLLAEAITAKGQHIQRFEGLVSKAQVQLVQTVDHGQAGKRFDELIAAVTAAGADPSKPSVSVSEALTGAISYTGLRRLAQDRIAREIAGAAQSRAAQARVTAIGVTAGAVAVFVIVVTLGVIVSRSISRPLRRLTRAAVVVADLARAELIRVSDSDDPEPAPPKLAAVDISSSDEIGELATALNRVQATAALLLERQVTTRRNVAVMFANIARRTQNLVGRQLSLIDDLERNERSLELLQRLYRLDHVATRLRRSADSLLVVSGTVDQVMSGAPSPLVDVIRSALAEIEGFRSVQLLEISNVTVSAGLVADLRLLLAELLENATNFSPPGNTVEVSAVLGEDCRIVIVDHGLGLSPARLDEENRRLIERERLDVAPTTVLGLFVVGRLARRHGLDVSLAHSPGRGVTVTVRIPSRLLSESVILTQPSAYVRSPGAAAPLAIEAAGVGNFAEIGTAVEHFAWFSRPPDEHVVTPTTVPAPSAPTPTTVPSPAVAFVVTSPNGATAGSVAAADPTDAALIDEMAGKSTAAAIGRASVPDVDPSLVPLPRRTVVTQTGTEPVPQPAGSTPLAHAASTNQSGLIRRIPGTHMVDDVNDVPDDSPTERLVRDPEAERDALNAYMSGLERTVNADAGSAQPSRPHVSERPS